MGFNFIAGDADQGFLLPPDVRDWLPADHLAWTVADVVEVLDLGPLLARYRPDGHGRAAYEPALMLRVLLYAWAVGVRSSRMIERACGTDVAFRVLAGNRAPDHTTISRFLRRHRDEVEHLFVEVLRVCAAAGLVRLGQVAVDGTKVAANASWSRNYTEAALAHQVAEAEAAAGAADRSGGSAAGAWLDEHLARDAAEDAAQQATPSEPSLPDDRDERLARLRAAQQRLVTERQARQAEQDAKVARHEQRRTSPDPQVRRRAGRRPSSAAPSGSTRGTPPRANTTDPDSRAMKDKHTLLQGYNAQAAVTDDQMIVGATLVQDPVDRALLHPVLDVTREQLRGAGLDPAGLDVVLADAGYASEDTFVRCEQQKLTLLAPRTSDEARACGGDPAGGRDLSRLPATERAQQRLREPDGAAAYARRGRTVEPVFGQIKTQQNLRQFRGRGLETCQAEWLLACTTHNLRKLHKNRPAGG